MKTETSCSCGTMKIPPCSKTINAGKRPNFCNPSPARGDRSIGMNYSNVSLIIINQSINQSINCFYGRFRLPDLKQNRSKCHLFYFFFSTEISCTVDKLFDIICHLIHLQFLVKHVYSHRRNPRLITLRSSLPYSVINDSPTIVYSRIIGLVNIF